jgi:hypothetical protein
MPDILSSIIRVKDRKMTIVQCYAPTEDGKADEKERRGVAGKKF